MNQKYHKFLHQKLSELLSGCKIPPGSLAKFDRQLGMPSWSSDQCQFQRCRFGNYAQVWNRGPEWDHEKIQSKQDKTEPCRTLIAEEPEEEEVEFKREKKKSSTPSWHSPSKTEQWWPTHKGTQADRWARGNKPAKTVVFLDNKDRKHG